jgi:hypothetical protein
MSLSRSQTPLTLKKILIEEWEKISIDLINKMMDSIPGRFRLCICENGKPIGHILRKAKSKIDCNDENDVERSTVLSTNQSSLISNLDCKDENVLEQESVMNVKQSCSFIHTECNKQIAIDEKCITINNKYKPPLTADLGAALINEHTAITVRDAMNLKCGTAVVFIGIVINVRPYETPNTNLKIRMQDFQMSSENNGFPRTVDLLTNMNMIPQFPIGGVVKVTGIVDCIQEVKRRKQRLVFQKIIPPENVTIVAYEMFP